jgi:hypothetical protein
MSGGGMHVRNDDPEIERIYPLEQWIPAQQRDGGKIYRRKVVVVEDWTEVARDGIEVEPPGETEA